jgi:urease accessory protein
MSGGKTRWTGLLAVVLLFLVLPSTAHAHLTVEGAGEIVSGALHPLMTPAHVLIILGLGLLLGQQVPLDLKMPMAVLACVSAAALALTATGRITGVYQPMLVVIALCPALLVALEKKPPRGVMAALCAAAAAGVGLDSGIENASAVVVVKSLLGTWISLNVVAGYLAICVSNSDGRPWARVGIRVLGSWIIAIVFLVLAFSLRK